MDGNRVATEKSTRGIRAPGYRLPDSTRLGRVQLQVADLARSLAYYETVLGFRVLARDAELAVLGAHGDDAPIVELMARRGARPAPQGGRLGLYHFAILLPDRAALGRFLSHLAAIGAYAGSSDHLVSEALYLRDPDGLGIEVYADRPRAEWRLEGRELAMDTKPLDRDAVVQASGGRPWKGMPAGTGLGHVHLHVGDLDRAAAFYHAALGFDKMVWSYPGALFLAAGGYHHHLGVNTWAGAGAAAPGSDEAQLLEWEIIVPANAVEAAARAIEVAGYGVERSGGGVLVADPWGTKLRITDGPAV